MKPKNVMAPLLTALFLLLVGATGTATGQEVPEGYRPVDIEEFNSRIAEADSFHEQWVGSPLLTVLKYTGEHLGARGCTIEAETLGSAEVGDSVRVVITREGFLDDSLSAIRYMFVLKLDEDRWFITEAYDTWRCVEGRGHTDFQPTPCY